MPSNLSAPISSNGTAPKAARKTRPQDAPKASGESTPVLSLPLSSDGPQTAPKPSKADARTLLGLYVQARGAIAMLDKAYRSAKLAGRTAPLSLHTLPEIVATINAHRAAIEAVPLSVTAQGGLNRADVWAALFGQESSKSLRTRCDASAEAFGFAK